MIQECLNHVKGCLIEIGINNIFEDEDNVNNHKGFKFAGILVGDETIEKDGSLVALDERQIMKRIYRRRLYTRELPVSVLIVDKNKDLVNEHLQTFLVTIGTGFKDANENYISITAGNPTWLEERSKLKQRSGVEISLTFAGGIYKDKEKLLVDLSNALQIETELGGV